MKGEADFIATSSETIDAEMGAAGFLASVEPRPLAGPFRRFNRFYEAEREKEGETEGGRESKSAATSIVCTKVASHGDAAVAHFAAHGRLVIEASIWVFIPRGRRLRV